MDTNLARRNFFFGGGATVLAAAFVERSVNARTDEAEAMTAEERRNVQVLKDYLAGWGKSNLDIDKLTTEYIAPNAQVRFFDDEDVLIGPEAAAKNAKESAGNDVRVTTKFLKIFARGPLVATARVDRVMLPGKPVQTIEVAGVAIIKEGKIHEYCDYIISMV